MSEKPKINWRIIWAGVELVGGVAMSLTFCMIFLGFVLSPGRGQNLFPGLVCAAFLAAGISCVADGVAVMRGKASPKVGNPFCKKKKPAAKASQPATDDVSNQMPITCVHCGATDIPDELGCCPYCGKPSLG